MLFDVSSKAKRLKIYFFHWNTFDNHLETHEAQANNQSLALFRYTVYVPEQQDAASNDYGF